MAARDEIILDVSNILRRFDPDGRLESYFDFLLSENKNLNLVSRETSRSDLRRLAAESLLPLDWIRLPIDTYLDIGSGGGFPAVPIILTGKVRSGSVLVERTRKKAAALGRILKNLGLNAEIVSATYEETRFKSRFELITIRLVKPTKPILRKIHVDLLENGSAVYYSAGSTDERLFVSQTITYRTSESSQSKQLSIMRKI